MVAICDMTDPKFENIVYSRRVYHGAWGMAGSEQNARQAELLGNILSIYPLNSSQLVSYSWMTYVEQLNIGIPVEPAAIVNPNGQSKVSGY
jgi:hypothetical protein